MDLIRFQSFCKAATGVPGVRFSARKRRRSQIGQVNDELQFEKNSLTADETGTGHPVTAEVDSRIYMAAERTFLAWIRTGIALMGFGFVVADLGCSCENSRSQAHTSHPHILVFRCLLGSDSSALG